MSLTVSGVCAGGVGDGGGLRTGDCVSVGADGLSLDDNASSSSCESLSSMIPVVGGPLYSRLGYETTRILRRGQDHGGLNDSRALEGLRTIKAVTAFRKLQRHLRSKSI